MIQSRVIADYREEQERAKQPGYVSRYDDYFDYDDDYDFPTDAKPTLQGPHRRPGQSEPRTSSSESEGTPEKRTPHSHLKRSAPPSSQLSENASDLSAESQKSRDEGARNESPRKPGELGNGFGAGIFES